MGAACPSPRVLGPQHHRVAHMRGRVRPAPVQRRLALLLRRAQQRPQLLLQGLHPSRVGRRWLPGSPQVRKRQREAGMLTSINGVRSPPALLMAKMAPWRPVAAVGARGQSHLSTCQRSEGILEARRLRPCLLTRRRSVSDGSDCRRTGRRRGARRRGRPAATPSAAVSFSVHGSRPARPGPGGVPRSVPGFRRRPRRLEGTGSAGRDCRANPSPG